MDELIIKLAQGIMPTDGDLMSELYEICDREHSHCNDACPVYLLNNHSCLHPDKPFAVNRGCDAFKNGRVMLEFIRSVKG